VVDSDDWLIGITGVFEVSKRDRRCVVGTWLGQAYWGTGANAESKALVAALAFGRLNMERLGAWADVRNPRSQRALERLGFVREGTLRGFHRHGDERRDVVSYSLLRDEWQQSALAGVDVAVIGEVPPEFTCPER
jgi:ribosomal-protein-alanine N-acetyltransferase